LEYLKGENEMEELIKCAYCREQHPKSEMMLGKITFISNGCICKEENWYCKNKPCHGYDQMAHEG